LHIILGITARLSLLDHQHTLQAMKDLLYKDFRDFPLPLMIPPDILMLAFIIGQLATLLSPALLVS
jgi:hypothetical protein